MDGLALYLILPDRAQPLLGTFVESEETPVVSEHNSPLAAAAAAKSFARPLTRERVNSTCQPVQLYPAGCSRSEPTR